MTPIQNLHFAIGELAYAIALADGKIQKEEREKFQTIVAEELQNKDNNFDIAEIIFQIMEKDKIIDSKTSYNLAIREIRINSHYLSPEMKQTFIKLIEKIANAFAPFTNEEKKIVEQFKKDIEPLIGDPIYYKK